MRGSNKPNTQILAAILGASKWEKFPRLLNPRSPSDSLARSAERFNQYVVSSDGLNLPIPNVKNLFDDDRSPQELLQQIGEFLRERRRLFPITDFILYFVGHGFVSDDQEYYLLLRFARENEEESSGLPLRALSKTVTENARDIRKFVIVDACYSGSAGSLWPAPKGPVTQQQQSARNTPSRGVTVLCSSDSALPSKALEGHELTAFTGVLMDVLSTRHSNYPELLCLRDIHSLMVQWPDLTIRPQLQSPDQREGDIADVPLFPNGEANQSPRGEEQHPTLQPTVARRVYAAAVAEWAASWRLFDSQHDIRIEEVYVEEVLRETAGGLFITTAHGTPVLGTAILAEVCGKSKRSGRNPLVWSVSGEAGVGKSTLLRQWTVILGRGTTGSATTGRCPLFVPLRHLSRELKSQGRQQVTPETLAAASRNIVPGVTEKVALAAFKDSSAVVYLLDGLDEMDEAVRPLMVDWLAGLPTDARAVVSLRPQIAVELHGLPRAVNYRVCDFSIAQIEQFVRQWFRNDPPLGEKFIATLVVSPRVREVAAIPLLLTGLCLDTETAGACGFAVSDNSRAVYRRVVAILFAEWDASKAHRRSDPVVVALGLAVFTGLAVRFPFDASFGLPDLRAEAELHAPRFGAGPATVDELINKATATGRLLVVEPTYGFAFAHRAFHDFFFAEGVLALNAGGELTS